jgi:hypothetical protein
MPKLLIFAPCERVILGQGDNSASLIVIVQKLQLNQLPGQKIDENAAMYARISLFTEWLKLNDDLGKDFEQRFTFGPVGEKPPVETVAEFKMSERTNRIIGVIEALPVVAPGEYEFSVWLRQKGTNWPDAPTASYPVEIVHAAGVLADK